MIILRFDLKCFIVSDEVHNSIHIDPHSSSDWLPNHADNYSNQPLNQSEQISRCLINSFQDFP